MDTAAAASVPRVPAWLPPGREVSAVLGLGSNIGDRLEHLQAAVDGLDADRRTRVVAVSSVYATVPVLGDAGGDAEQDDYLNAAVAVATRRSPAGLLRLAHRVESSRGRTREVRWGPRTLDVDVLVYGKVAVGSATLTVPHPRLPERAFALIPALEVAPDGAFPDGRTLVAALAALAPIEGVIQVGRQLVVPPGRAA